MSHNITSHRRILAAPDPKTPMDPTQRKPKPNPSAAKNHHPRQPPPLLHPLPDPTIAPPPSTIQNISHRFSRLYANHKKQVSSKPGPHPLPDPHFRTRKDPSFSPPVSDSSCTTTTTLTKSSSHKEGGKSFGKNDRNYHSGAKTKVKEKSDDFKKLKIPSFQSMLEKDEEGLNGAEDGNKRRSSMSSIPPVVNGGGRRKSFCNSQVELADFLACSGVKVVAVDMPPFMQVHAVDCARKAHDSLEKFTSKTLAFTLKKEFDGVYGPAWHCIVGTSFGSFVTHSVGGFMYFSMDHKLYILLFKTTVQRAE